MVRFSKFKVCQKAHNEENTARIQKNLKSANYVGGGRKIRETRNPIGFALVCQLQ